MFSFCSLESVCDVEDQLHVHGSLRYAGTPSVNDGNQSAVHLVHVALGEEPASGPRLVLHLGGQTHTATQKHYINLKSVACKTANALIFSVNYRLGL